MADRELPPLPEASAHHCWWDVKHEGDTCWEQWHDSLDPMPVAWADDETPDRVDEYYDAAQMHAYATQATAKLRAELAAERGRAQHAEDAAGELEFDLRDATGRLGVLAGLLREARALIEERYTDIGEPAFAALTKIDAALGPASDDLLTGDGK